MGLSIHEHILTTQSDVAPGVVRQHRDDVVTHRTNDVVTLSLIIKLTQSVTIQVARSDVPP